MIFLTPLCKKLLLISIISIIVIPATASDNGNKGKKSKIEKKDQIEKNTTEDIGTQVELKYNENPSSSLSYDENVETMAYWHISQSIPKSEKVIKKEELDQEKINRKIIKKEKKECKKLQQSLKKNKPKSKNTK
jgi:hypothetical protein